MQDLIKQEQFELEVLDKLNSKKLLSNLIFTGGTMLRLCFGLERFSVDLDFWIKKRLNNHKLFRSINDCLSDYYSIRDAVDKLNTWLFEIKSKDYPRSLKIEIRKRIEKTHVEQAIAYSKFTNIQVFLNVVSLQAMMQAKIKAFLVRKEIRDVFDIEFLLKKGIKLEFPQATLKILLKEIEKLTKNDYSVKLGSLLEEDKRSYYNKENFKILKLAINEKIKNIQTR